MFGICLVIWCVGNAPLPTETRLTATQDVYNKETGTRTLVMAESAGLFGGYIYQNDTRDAVFVGGLPLHIQITPSVHLSAGALAASSPMPRRGTYLNFIAKAQFNINEHLAIEFVHMSNAGVGGRPNPAIDSVGVSFKLK